MGFKTPAPLVGLSGRGVFSHTSVTASWWFSTADKALTNDGWTSWGDVAVLCRLPRGFEAGPALLVRHTSTSGWEKTSIYPSLAAEKRFALGRQPLRASVRVHFRDQWTQNNGRGATVALETAETSGLVVKASWTTMAFTLLPGDASPYASGMTVTFGYRFARKHR